MSALMTEEQAWKEADLQQLAAINAKQEAGDEPVTPENIVEVNTRVNARCSGFYAGVKFIQKPRPLLHWLPILKKVRPLHPIFDRRMPGWVADQYIAKCYVGMRPPQELEIRAAIARGFSDGCEYMWKVMGEHGTRT